jgi:hypothetical protein
MRLRLSVAARSVSRPHVRGCHSDGHRRRRACSASELVGPRTAIDLVAVAGVLERTKSEGTCLDDVDERPLDARGGQVDALPD